MSKEDPIPPDDFNEAWQSVQRPPRITGRLWAALRRVARLPVDVWRQAKFEQDVNYALEEEE